MGSSHRILGTAGHRISELEDSHTPRQEKGDLQNIRVTRDIFTVSIMCISAVSEGEGK